MTGFLEESAGVRSVTRLIAVIITLLACVLVGLIVWYVVHVKAPDAGVLAALGGILAAVVAHGAVAIVKRGTGEAGE